MDIPNRRDHQPGSWDEMPKRDYAEGNPRWHEMPVLEGELASGKTFALMLAIYKCAQRGQPIPAWAARAFSTGFCRVYEGHARSWDEVFGLPRSTRMHAAKVQPRRELRSKIFDRIADRRSDDPGISADLFAKVASEFGVHQSTVSELYYEAKALKARPIVRNPGAEEPELFTDTVLNLLNDPDPFLDCDDPELPADGVIP